MQVSLDHLSKKLKEALDDSENLLKNVKDIRDEAFEPDIQSKLNEAYVNLTKLYNEKLKAFYEKASNGIMEVAFAGAEKTGKSTFINAFIERNLLPSAHERTTFTITEVRYSEENKVEVEFYSKEEFNKEVLQKLLLEAHYPGWDKTELDILTWEEVDRHFKKLSTEQPEIYKGIQSQVDNDLKDILKDGKEIIKRHLTGGKNLYKEEDIEAYKEFIVDRYKSRAVKRVTIYTPKLENIKNVIIYDLPGFDSPTIVHSKFTEEMLKKVDAVVFVKKLIEPSIKRPEIQMINNVREEDGIPLREKTFYFLNQADYADDIYVLEKDKQKFIEELKEHNIYNGDDKIFAGSARAVLQKIGVENGKTQVMEKAKQLGVLDSIDELKKALRDFYERERAKILEHRSSKVLNDIKSIVQQIIELLEVYAEDSEQSSPVDEKFMLLVDEWRKSLRNELEDFQRKMKNKIYETKEKSESLSKKLELQITSKVTYPTDEEIEEAKKNVEVKTSTREERPDSFNKELREKISERLEREVRLQVSIAFENEINKIYQDVTSIFTDTLQKVSNALFPEKSINLKDNEQLQKSVENFVTKHEFAKMYEITALVMRFTGDIMEIMVSTPMSFQERNKKFKEIESEIYSLAAFYKDFDPSKPLIDSEFIKIVKGKRIYSENDYQKLANKLKESLKSGIDRIDEVLRRVRNEKIDVFYLIEKITKLAPKTVDEVFNIMNRLGDSTEANIQPSTYEEVLDEIKSDLENFKTIISEVIVKAVYPEKAFVNALSLYIRELISKLSFDSAGAEEFRKLALQAKRYIAEEYKGEHKKKQRFAWLSTRAIEELRNNLTKIG